MDLKIIGKTAQSSQVSEQRQSAGRKRKRLPKQLSSKGHSAASSDHRYTVSIALPSSILLNAQSSELRTYLVGQIARAAAIFKVTEIVVWDDDSVTRSSSFAPTPLFARLLQYVETPQYLRKALFPYHPDLRFAGLLNPLDTPHHPRISEQLPCREGSTVSKLFVKNGKSKHGNSSSGTPAKAYYANVGLRKLVRLDRQIQDNVRVTVQLDPTEEMPLTGTLVAPSTPRERFDMYWGYQTRVAQHLSQVFTESPFQAGYDLTIGTSERGDVSIDDKDFILPSFRHALIVFGGLAGIEASVDATELIGVPGSEANTLFDVWLNICSTQGSRTIRTEEAILIAMARLDPFLKQSGT